MSVIWVVCAVVAAGLVPRHQLQLQGNASLGYYYATILVGSPAQAQSVIVDTGSGVLALPCSQCVQCSRTHMHPLFDLTRSNSSKIVTCDSNACSACSRPTDPCSFSISYAEGSSISGILIQDHIRFENSDAQAIKTIFGCTTKETNLFLTQQANGIMGFAPHRNNTLLEDMVRAHAPFTHQKLAFSLCLASNGGVLNFGRYDTKIHSPTKTIKTSFQVDKNLYSLNHVGEIRIGTNIIHKSGTSFGIYGIFIDSGSTYTYFQPPQYTLLKKYIDQICTNNSKQCQIMTSSSSRCYKLSFKDPTRLLSSTSLSHAQPFRLLSLSHPTRRLSQISTDVQPPTEKMTPTPIVINDKVDTNITNQPNSDVNIGIVDTKSWMDPTPTAADNGPQTKGDGEQNITYREGMVSNITGDVFIKEASAKYPSDAKEEDKGNDKGNKGNESNSKDNGNKSNTSNNYNTSTHTNDNTMKNKQKTIDDLVTEIFPPIQVDINGETIKWVPTKYMLLRSLGNMEVCLGIQQLDRTLLGANFIVNTDVYFDLQQKTVQFFFNSTCTNQNPTLQIAVFNFADFHSPKEIIYQLYDQSKWLLIAFVLLTISCLVMLLIKCSQNDQNELLRVPTHEEMNYQRGRRKRKMYGGMTSLGIEEIPSGSNQRL